MPLIDEGQPQPHDLTNFVPTAEQVQRQNDFIHRDHQSEMAWLTVTGAVVVGLLWFAFSRRRKIGRAASQTALDVAAYSMRASKKINSGLGEFKKAIQDREREL